MKNVCFKGEEVSRLSDGPYNLFEIKPTPFMHSPLVALSSLSAINGTIDIFRKPRSSSAWQRQNTKSTNI